MEKMVRPVGPYVKNIQNLKGRTHASIVSDSDTPDRDPLLALVAGKAAVSKEVAACMVRRLTRTSRAGVSLAYSWQPSLQETSNPMAQKGYSNQALGSKQT